MVINRSRLMLGAATAAMALGAWSQAAAQSEVIAVDEVIVTATRREASVQDVPLSVTAFGQEALRRQDVRDVVGLQALAPSLQVSSTTPPSLGSSFIIRGVGTSGQNTGLEGAVGFFLDGVYRSRSGTALGEITDLERIEVLRGPQGTLFGKNTSAGAVSVTTRSPDTNKVEGGADATIAEHGAYGARAYLNVPIAEDRLAVRFAAGYSHRDGVVKDLRNGRDYNDRDRYNVRGSLLWTPNDDVRLRVVADYGQGDEACCQPVTVAVSQTAAVVAGFTALSAANGGVYVNPPRPDDRVTSINQPISAHYGEGGVLAELNWDLGFGELTSVSAYRKFEDNNFNDIDFSAADVLNRRSSFHNRFYTQELRLNGKADGVGPFRSVDWLVGAYYADEKLGRDDVFFLGNQIASLVGVLRPGLAFSEFSSQKAETFALFTHNSFRLDDHWVATFGLRWTSEDKTAGALLPVAQPIAGAVFAVSPPFAAKTDETEWSGTAILQYYFGDDVNAYGSYSRGYKGGGINLDFGNVPAGFRTFKPEFADSFELGLKSIFWNRRAQVNVAVFRTEFSDFQSQSFNGLNFTLRNIAGVTTQGVEIDGQLRPIEPLLVNFGLNYTDATYDDNVTDRPSAVLPPFAGQRLANAPKWSGSVSVNWEQDLAGTDLRYFLRAQTLFKSSYSTNTFFLPAMEQSAYALLDLRAGLQTKDGRWELMAFCRNCTEERVLDTVFLIPLQTNNANPAASTMAGFVNEPRQLGATVTFKY